MQTESIYNTRNRYTSTPRHTTHTYLRPAAALAPTGRGRALLHVRRDERQCLDRLTQSHVVTEQSPSREAWGLNGGRVGGDAVDGRKMDRLM